MTSPAPSEPPAGSRPEIPSAAPILAGLGDAATRTPHTAALFLPEGPPGRGASGWRPVTYSQLWRRARAVAAGLGAIGFGPGDRTVLLVPPSADFFALMFGVQLAGVVPVLVDPGIGREHLKRCLDEAEPVGFIGTPKAHVARVLLRWTPSVRRRVVTGTPRLTLPTGLAGRRNDRPGSRSSGGTLHTLAEVERLGADRHPAGPAEGTAAILFTSGSTGPPKGVEYSHDNFAAQCDALRRLYGLGPADVQLATFPPLALFGPALGMPTVVPRMDPTRPAAVDPRNIVEPITALGATVMFGSPALLDTVSGWAVQRGVRLTGLRLVMSAGAPVSRRIVTATSSILDTDARLVTPYGATEALPVASISHRELLDPAAAGNDAGYGVCVGTPAPGVRVGVMRITDDPVPALSRGDLLPAGELGEIVVSGRVVTRGYFGRPAATAAAKTQWDGELAHRMGDVGLFDADGRLWFCGRKAHLISTPQDLIAPVPVEVVFNGHSWVHRSALIGVGPAGHQRPCLCVELAPGAPAPAVVQDELRRLAGEQDRTAVVHDIRIHPGFPVDIRHNAKINYAALVQWWERG